MSEPAIRSSPRRLAWRRFLSNRAAIAGGLFMCLFLLLAILAPRAVSYQQLTLPTIYSE